MFGERADRGLRIGAAVMIGWALVGQLGDTWRAIEAAVAGWVLRLGGQDDVDRVGRELLATSAGGQRFSAVVSPWCSTMVLVVAFAVATVVVPFGRRWQAFASAAATVIVCNVARIVATVFVGIKRGPGAIEPFHDGPATWFAVLYVVVALAAFGVVLTGGATRSDSVLPPTSPQAEATTPGRL